LFYLDELRNYDWASRSLRKKIKTIEEACRELRIGLNREPTEIEIARKLKLSLKEYRKLLTESKAVTVGVFRYQLNSEENLTQNQKIKYMCDNSEKTPYSILEREELRTRMVEIIEGLPEKNKLVLSLYYIEDLNLKEIAEILKLTESRISQIRAEAIIKLKARINELAEMNKVDSKQFLGG
jgi:RNA polymerase sigma factor for flagellar operon FliA